MKNWISNEFVLLETDIDDLNPQLYGRVMERLYEHGNAIDVALIPAFMKKNRPGVLLSVLCAQNRYEDCLAIIFAETSTLGVRKQLVECIGLPKEIIWVATSLGRVRVKVVNILGQVRYHPEYEDCNKLAEELKMPLVDVIKVIERDITSNLGSIE